MSAEAPVVTREEKLRDYVFFDALSLLISLLGVEGTSLLDNVVPQRFMSSPEFVAPSGTLFNELWPDDESSDGEEAELTGGLACIVTGEIFLTLASSSQRLAEEGHRLVGLGRARIEKTVTGNSHA